MNNELRDKAEPCWDETARRYMCVGDCPNPHTKTLIEQEAKPVVVPPKPAAQPVDYVPVVKALLSYAEGKTCRHETTHRGGAIWEICDECGQKWADDRGGRPEWVEPKALEDAFALLASKPAAQPHWTDNHIKHESESGSWYAYDEVGLTYGTYETKDEARDALVIYEATQLHPAAQPQQEAEPVVEVGEGQILQWAPPYKRYPEGTKFYLHPPKPAAQAAGLSDGQINEITLNRLGKWPSFEAQSWACKVVRAVAALPQVPEGYQLVPVQLIEFIEAKEFHLPVEDRHVLSVMLSAAKEES